MVKDILINIEASDVQLIDRANTATIYYETKWGKIFNTDDESRLYLNVIVSYNQLSLFVFDTDGAFSCNVKSSYYPEDKEFYIRFIVEQNGEYKSFKSASIPNTIKAKSYVDDFYNLSPISACQLLNVNENGNYKIMIRNRDLLSAIIYSSESNDLLYGSSDDQSAKLLSLCAPGNNYRFPISGVDITSYINTVIDNTNLGKRMIDEFKSNNTPVISASFNNSNGSLNIEQSSEEEHDLVFDELTSTDFEIIQAADDDFIRRFTLSVSDDDINASDILLELAKLTDIYVIYEFGDVEKTLLQDEKLPGYALVYGTNTNGKSDFVGFKNTKFATISASLGVGDLIYLNNAKTLSYTDGETKEQIVVPFVITPPEATFDGENTMADASYYKRVSVVSSKNTYDECAIIMKKCKLFYSCLVEDLNDIRNGVYRISINNASIKNLLVLTHDHLTGRLMAYVSANTNITGIQQNQEKSQLIISIDNKNE